MSSSTPVTTPEVLWAQRSNATVPEKNYIHLTISVPDVPASSIKIDLQPTSLTFTGHSDTKKTTYHIELNFYGEIDVKNSKTNHTARDVEFILRKKEVKEEYWPRLLKDNKKMHFLKTNFDKWVDEDEQEEKPDDADYNNMAGMGGMPGMGGGDGGFGGIDFSKLGGGAGGMPDLDLPDGGADAGGDDSDDDMPELEDEEETKEAAGGEAKAAPKIEELS